MTSGLAVRFSGKMLHLGGLRPVCVCVLSEKQTYSGRVGGGNAARRIALVRVGFPGESTFLTHQCPHD